MACFLVGTGRFELPTPRTPSECSTRLSHVPTIEDPLSRNRGLQRKGLRKIIALRSLAFWTDKSALRLLLLRWWDVLFGQLRPGAEEILLHLLHQKLLGLGLPRLQAIFVQQHLGVFGPHPPGFGAYGLIDFLP